MFSIPFNRVDLTLVISNSLIVTQSSQIYNCSYIKALPAFDDSFTLLVERLEHCKIISSDWNVYVKENLKVARNE